MHTAAKTERTVYFDVLNILAALNVVWMHFGNNVHQYDVSAAWHYALVSQVLAFWAVPVFLMLSGATLLDYRERCSTGEYLKRRFLRVGLPYLFWGTLMVLYHILTGEFLFDGTRPLRSFCTLFFVRLNETLYWFFPVILLMYCLIPLGKGLAGTANRGRLNKVLFVCVVLFSLVPCAGKLLQRFGLAGPAVLLERIHGLRPLAFMLYPLLGYWASRRSFSRGERVLLYLTALALTGLRWWDLATASARAGEFTGLFTDYLCPPAVAGALAVFVCVRQLCEKHSLPRKIRERLKGLASLSFGVYLTHMAVLAVMGRLPFFGKGSAAWYFFWPVPCYALTACAVAAAKRIPGVKRLLP